MGGQGSGRRPDPLKQFTPTRTNVSVTNADVMELPNYSGVKEEARKNDPTNIVGGTETDPIWNAQSGAYLLVAQSGAFLTAETDPEWSAQSGAYVKVVDSGAHLHLLDDIGNPSGDVQFNMANKQMAFSFTNPSAGNSGAFDIGITGAFQGDALHIHQHTGNPGAGTHLIHLEASDSDVCPLETFGAGVWDIEATQGILSNTVLSGAASYVGVNHVLTQEQSGAWLQSYTETDPIWNAQSGGFVTLGQSGAHSHAAGETDPIWNAQSGAFLKIANSGAHVIAQHSDTTATGAELETLTDGSNADALHSHTGLGTETDPIWVAQSGSFLLTNQSGAFLTAETDPEWSAQSGAYLKIADSGAFMTSGGANLTGDHTSSGAPEIANTIYSTSATSPVAANATPIGTVYFQYTA